MKMKIQPIKNVWDTAKAELRRQPIALITHVRNKKSFPINPLTSYSRDYKKQSKIKPK